MLILVVPVFKQRLPVPVVMWLTKQIWSSSSLAATTKFEKPTFLTNPILLTSVLIHWMIVLKLIELPVKALTFSMIFSPNNTKYMGVLKS